MGNGRDPSGQALVASDEAPAGLHPSGFDPSREETAAKCDWCEQYSPTVGWLGSYLVCEKCAESEPAAAELGGIPDIRYRGELALFTSATAVLWRAVQRDERCDLAECVHKFGGNCHCMGTFLALGMDALNAAIATEARRAETSQDDSVHEGAGPKDIAQTPSERSA